MELLLSLTLFGSIFWGIFFVAFFIIMCFVADISENGFLATFFLIVIGMLFYVFGKETWQDFVSILTVKNFVIYFSLGLIHAIVRVYFHGRKEMQQVNQDRIDGKSYEHTIERNIREHVFRWWFLWPVSLIDWFIKDMIKDIYNWVYKQFSKLFDFIMDLVIKSVK